MDDSIFKSQLPCTKMFCKINTSLMHTLAEKSVRTSSLINKHKKIRTKAMFYQLASSCCMQGKASATQYCVKLPISERHCITHCEILSVQVPAVTQIDAQRCAGSDHGVVNHHSRTFHWRFACAWFLSLELAPHCLNLEISLPFLLLLDQRILCNEIALQAKKIQIKNAAITTDMNSAIFCISCKCDHVHASLQHTLY